MATTAAETEELARLREELASERQRRIEAEGATRRATWHVLDEISRKLPLLLAWVDRECRFHFANERYAALFGQTPDSIRSMTLREFYGETIWNRIEGHVHRALGGERVEFDVNDPTLEDPCLFRVTYVPDRDAAGEVRGFFLSLYDVKEVRRAERASAFLAEASHLLAGTLDDRRVLDAITRLAVPRLSDWCFVDYVDDDGGMRRVAVAHPPDADPAIVRRHARYFPPKEAAFNVVNTARSGQAVVQNQVDDALIQSVARDADHLEILRAVGMRSFISAPLSARGRTFGVMTFVRTKGVFSAADLELATDLGRRVALAIDNNRLYAEAQEANRAKDDFLATLSHELRTPLTAILGWASALQEDVCESPLLQEGLATIQRSARIQAQLVDDVLDVSRIVSGKLRLDFEDVDLAAVVDSAREQVESHAASKRIAIDAHGSRPAPVSGDRVRLEQVVWNLLANAVKFSPEGSTIRVRWNCEEAVTLDVTDEGEGIDPEVLPHIFERFRQADSSTTRRHGGLGLGLSIVHHLVEGHGGTVTVESEGIGRGATFRVRLPAREPAGRAEPRAESEESRLETRRLLVVDDEEAARHLFATVLRRAGAEVVAVADAAEALEAYARQPFDAVVSDIAMPKCDGYELLARLQERGPVRALAVSAFGRGEERQRIAASGFAGYVQKPVEAAALVRAVAALFEEEQTR